MSLSWTLNADDRSAIIDKVERLAGVKQGRAWRWALLAVSLLGVVRVLLAPSVPWVDAVVLGMAVALVLLAVGGLRRAAAVRNGLAAAHPDGLPLGLDAGPDGIRLHVADKHEAHPWSRVRTVEGDARGVFLVLEVPPPGVAAWFVPARVVPEGWVDQVRAWHAGLQDASEE